MDKLLQNEKEMQDEELYALLDRAMETECLRVSEDLIQKTLKRVAEQEDAKVVSFEKAAKRKLPAMKYVSVAAAALFVAVLGVGVLRGGVVSKDNTQMEATYDITSRKSGAELQDAAFEPNEPVTESKNDGAAYYYSTSDVGDMSDVVAESESTLQQDRVGHRVTEQSVGMPESVYMSVPENLVEALTAVGAEPVSGEAEYWEFVQRETTWESELFKELTAAMDVFENKLPKDEAYEYSIECKGGGRQTVFSEFPLDGIVRIETKKGILWGFLGEYVRFYAE